MTDYNREDRWSQLQQKQESHHPFAHQITKAATVATLGGSMLLLSGLAFAGTVIGLALSSPLLVIFSPVLVPATIAVVLIAGGFFVSGVFGVAAILVFLWMYRYVNGKRPVGADGIDRVGDKISSKAREYKESAQILIQQATS